MPRLSSLINARRLQELMFPVCSIGMHRTRPDKGSWRQVFLQSRDPRLRESNQ